MPQTREYWTQQAVDGFAMMLQAGSTPEELKAMFSDVIFSQVGESAVGDLEVLIEKAKEQVDEARSD